MLNRPNHPHLRAASLSAQEGLISDPALLDEATFEDAREALIDVDGQASADVLRPWGKAGPPPSDKWVEDLLGQPFESRTLPLKPDEEGDVNATLVRLKPGRRRAVSDISGEIKRPLTATHPRFVLLYLHGRNDYFFHAEAADAFSRMGAAFYALDLRKYGRSLRPWQTIGYSDDLAVYDEEIDAALEMMRGEHPGLPVFLVAHSTGGLIATLWAWRHQDALDGLILNSAWLELQVHANIRNAIHRVSRRVAQVRPRAAIVGVSKTDSYYRSLTDGWAESGLEVPDYFAEGSSDPAYIGWKIHPEWKHPYSYAAPAAWVSAILDGHESVEKDVHLACPVLALASTSFGDENAADATLFSSDVVLDADVITERAAGLSDSVVIARFPGKHDLLLSDPPVRRDVYSTIQRWLDYVGVPK